MPAVEEQARPFLEFEVDGRPIRFYEEYITGEEIKGTVGIPLETDLYLSIVKPWKDELIGNKDRVNLARPGIEYFYVKKKLELTINGRPFTWYKQYILGSELRSLGHIDEAEDLFLTIEAPFDDELIANDLRIDLARPTTEHFVSKPKSIYTLIVNAQPKTWNKPTITYDEVVTVAFGNGTNHEMKAYTVAYSKGRDPKPKGILAEGDEVQVKNEMRFDVSATDKS